MLDTPTSSNYRDFHARYNGTYGWLVRENKPKQLVKLLECGEDELHFKLDEGGTVYHANVDSGVMFEFQQVERGFYKVKDTVWYLARIPSRQWKRGICTANTQLLYLDNVSGNRFYGAEERGFDTFKGILTTPQNYVNDGSAVATKHNVLSKHFCVSATGHVFFYMQCIGQVKDGVITLNSIGEIVKQELQDVIKRNNWGNMFKFGDSI